MWKCSTLMIFLSSSLLYILQTLHFSNAATCYGSSFKGDSSRYAHNRRRPFSTLPNDVVTNGGFYNASVGQNINRVYALGLCTRGYDPEACLSCIPKWTRDTQTSCLGRIDSYIWANDDTDRVLCLVRSSRNSTFGNLDLSSHVIGASPNGLASSKNTTLFAQEWEATANRTVEAATKAENSSVKYYSAVKAGFTEFLDVYMLMLCTPDLTSQDCKKCLEACVTYYKKDFPGRQGGMANFPSCLFRWDLYPFHGAFHNVTRVPAPPRPPAKENECSITNKKGRSISHRNFIVTIVILTFIYVLVFFGYNKFYARRIKPYRRFIGGAEFSDSDGQFMLRFNLGTILMATNDFSSENTLGQGGFGTVYKGTLLNGKEVAVKRLARGSSQGNMEFKNEVSLLTRLQHRNLVKLLGFCSEDDEEVLVYEFVPNSSLDHFIFDEEKRSLLTWEVRCKIMEGIARGLLYLHEDSQLKIIHRDLKASNIF